jgi:hypothetical protein
MAKKAKGAMPLRAKGGKILQMMPGAPARQSVTIAPPNFKEATFRIIGTAPYCMNKMSSENRKKMMDKQMEGSRSKKGTLRTPKDFDAIYRGSMHISTQGWHGIPAAGIRAALISACRVVGFAMTRAKLSLFVIHDGLDQEDGQPLVRIKGKPVRRDHTVKLADGSSDIIARAFFDDWEVSLHLEWDGDQFSATDVANLLARVGKQVGLGAGRHDSKSSSGMGWGTFRVAS